jgi:hypothetical protein
MVFKATLEYVRKGMPINLEPFAQSWVATRPFGDRAIYVFDKDTMYGQKCTLKDIHDLHGRPICTASTANKGAVFPRDAFTLQPPDHVFFNQRCLVSMTTRLRFWWSLIPVIRVIGTEEPSRRVSQTSCNLGSLSSPIVLVYALPVVVLVPRDRVRRALKFEKGIIDAISRFKSAEPSTKNGPEWELPIYLKGYPIEADCVYLQEILDISLARGKLKVWEEVMEILCLFKSANEIGTSRIFASIEKFSFKKARPLYVPQLVVIMNTADALVALTSWSHDLRQWMISLPSLLE